MSLTFSGQLFWFPKRKWKPLPSEAADIGVSLYIADTNTTATHDAVKAMTFSDIPNSYNTKYKVIKANSYYLHNQMTIKNINFNNKIKTKVILQEYVLVFVFY